MKIFFKNFFNYKYFFSRSFLLLFFISIFLSLISFVKGIQILMFVPAFIFSIFLYSFLELFFIKINLSFESNGLGNFLKLYFKNNKKVNFIIFNKEKNGFHNFLIPNSNLSYDLEFINDLDLYLYVFGRFDIFRKKIHIGNIRFNNKNDLENDLYFEVCEYQDGDELKNIDGKKSSLSEKIFIKKINLDIDSKTDFKLGIISNTNLEIKGFKNLDRQHFFIILLGIFGIIKEWEDVLFNIYLLVSFAFIYFLKLKRFKINNFQLKSLFIFFFLIMLIISFFKGDMTGAGSVFLIQLLLISFLLPNGDKKSFLYIFLSLFIFVAISLFSSEFWFILAFLLYLFISIYLLFFISGDETYNKFNYKIGSKINFIDLFKTFLTTFLLIFCFYLILPHGDSRFNGGSIENLSTVSGFNIEIDLDNVSKISLDNSKIFLIENIDYSDINKYGLNYFRGSRLYEYSNNKWKSNIDKDKISYKKLNSDGDKITLDFNFYSKIGKNIFIPATVENISNTVLQDYFGNLFYNTNNDNTILTTRANTSNGLSMSLTFLTGTGGKIIDDLSSNFDYKINLSDSTKNLLNDYIETIPTDIIDSPYKLLDFVQNKSGFTYSIENPAKNLDDFLYGSKMGHCEYFATTLALVLQYYGYSATVTNGYVGGEYNDIAKSLIIRGKNAHSWVELYNEEENSWIRLDPTPVSNNIELTQDGGFFDTMKSYYDFIEIKWFTYIVNYSFSEQLQFYKFILDKYYYFLFVLTIFIFFKKILKLLKKIFKFFGYSKKLKIGFLLSITLGHKYDYLNSLKVFDYNLYFKYEKILYKNNFSISYLDFFIDLIRIIIFKIKYYCKKFKID